MTNDAKDWQTGLRQDILAAIEATGLPLCEYSEIPSNTFHLAILVEPYLEWILRRLKTIESRFSMRRIAPYRVVSPGDILALKRSSGDITGVCRVAQVEHFELNPSVQKQIRTRYSVPLCAENAAFWEDRSRFRYATLIHLIDVRRLTPFACRKQDRRGWVVLSKSAEGE